MWGATIFGPDETPFEARGRSPRGRARCLAAALTRPRAGSAGRRLLPAHHVQRALPGQAAARAVHERGVPPQRRVRAARCAHCAFGLRSAPAACAACVRLTGRARCAVYSDGTLCMDIIQDQWSPIHNVCTLLTSIQARRDRVCAQRRARASACACARRLRAHQRALLLQWPNCADGHAEPADGSQPCEPCEPGGGASVHKRPRRIQPVRLHQMAPVASPKAFCAPAVASRHLRHHRMAFSAARRGCA